MVDAELIKLGLFQIPDGNESGASGLEVVFDLREQSEVVGTAGEMVEDSQGGDEIISGQCRPESRVGNIGEEEFCVWSR